MPPMIHINYLAVAVTVLVNFMFAWLWYSPLLFAKVWAKEIGMSMDQKPDPKVMMRGMILAFWR